MSHFYGTVCGSRGEATRGGSKPSGLHVQAASWEGCVEVSLTFDKVSGQDVARVALTQWHGRGQYPSRVLYDGPVSGGERLPLNGDGKGSLDSVALMALQNAIEGSGR